MPLTLRSPAFSHQAPIPVRHTCDGADEPPPLEWSGVPPGAKSLALIVDDPDAPDPKAPKQTFVHWVLYNIPPSMSSIGQNGPTIPDSVRAGTNDANGAGWSGPCPPIGRHRYFFKLFALDIELPDLDQPTAAKLENAMEGHVVGRTEIVGTYERAT